MSIDEQLLKAILLILPFQVSEIKEVEENCGTVWITLNDGKVYSLAITETEE
jgi:hypothetical protein